nr:MAG TPA: hypothetical protein [Caudoviricetes sp.]
MIPISRMFWTLSFKGGKNGRNIGSSYNSN